MNTDNIAQMHEPLLGANVDNTFWSIVYNQAIISVQMPKFP